MNGPTGGWIPAVDTRDPGEVLTDGGEVLRKVCPECDSTMIEPKGSGLWGKQTDHRWLCKQPGCGHRFDDPNERPLKQPPQSGLSPATQALEEADPADIRPDGGHELPDSIEAFVEAAEDRETLPCRECGDEIERQFLEDGRCIGCRNHIVTDGGAVDHEYDEAERSPREQLEANLAPLQTQPVEGGVAIDLVTRKPLFIRRRVADSVVDYYAEEGVDLASYKTHPYLPVRLDDPVYECAFVPRDAERIHSISKTYDFPRGRLATIPVWTAWKDDGGEFR